MAEIAGVPHVDGRSAGATRPRRRLLAGRRLGVFLIICLLIAWELSARTGLVVSQNWPPVSEVFVAAVRDLLNGELLAPIAGTLYRTVVGFLMGTAAGILIGLMMTAIPLVRLTLAPTVELLRPLPVPALAPPLVLFLGLDDPMKITLVAFTAFFPVLINTIEGALSIEPTYRAVAATFGMSWLATVRKVLFPATLPYIMAGMRISLGLSLIVAVVGEMIAGSAGVGYYLVSMQYAERAPDMYAALLLIGIGGYLLNEAFLFVEHRVLHWHDQGS